jgi:iron(II)-dependent oxidoreductase
MSRRMRTAMERNERELLEQAMRSARERCLGLVNDLSDAEWMGPRLPITNPLLWELGHVGWFQEYWVLRHARGAAPILAQGDALYDSARVAHDLRWDLPLVPRERVLGYLSQVLERAALALADTEDPYFHWLAVFHEDMHGEAFCYTRQTLSYPLPGFLRAGGGTAATEGSGPLSGDVEVPGGRTWLGARPGDGFVHDNEKWAHPVDVATFRIARAPVTNADFAAFVEAGGYRDERLWSADGWAWRCEVGAEQPLYWSRAAGGGWQERQFAEVAPLAPFVPILHVNWHEAQAFCRWAGRRLPTEPEWELAASGHEKRRFPWGDAPPDATRANLDGRRLRLDVVALPDGDSPFGCRQMLGNVWEWTDSRFGPFPGFVADPYKEYSEPWFATPHMVLRGGCFATRARLIRNTWRNFYPPHRRDVLAGFRTCAA